MYTPSEWFRICSEIGVSNVTDESTDRKDSKKHKRLRTGDSNFPNFATYLS
jgi:hypothetical protein